MRWYPSSEALSLTWEVQDGDKWITWIPSNKEPSDIELLQERISVLENAIAEDGISAGLILNVSQVAKSLGVSRPTVYRLIESGALPAKKLSTGSDTAARTVVLSEDLKRFLSGMPDANETRMSEGMILNVTQTAEALGVSRTTVYKLVESGALPAKKFASSAEVESRTVILVEDLKRYMADLPRVKKRDLAHA